MLARVEQRISEASITPPLTVISRRRKNESYIDLRLKCPNCKLPAAFVAQYVVNKKPVYYHLIAETQSPDVEDCVDQLLMSCINASDDVIEEMIVVLSRKYMELIE